MCKQRRDTHGCRRKRQYTRPKYPHRETPAGEFILVTRRGSYEYYGMGYTKYTIRINGSYYLAEIPTTKKNGSKFLEMPDELGAKATRGNICIAHDASTDGGINAGGYGWRQCGRCVSVL